MDLRDKLLTDLVAARSQKDRHGVRAKAVHAALSDIRRGQLIERNGLTYAFDDDPQLIQDKEGNVVGVDAMVRVFRGKKELQVDPHRICINPPTHIVTGEVLGEKSGDLVRTTSYDPVEAYLQWLEENIREVPNPEGFRTRGTVTTVYSGTNDGQLLCLAIGNYSNARAGIGSLGANTALGTIQIGQTVSGPAVYLGYVDFDTSPIPDGDSVSAVSLQLDGNTDTSSTDFTLEARVYNWGGTLTTADWVPGASQGALTRVATWATSSFSAGYNSFTEDGTNFQSAINKTGTTSLLLTSAKTVAGTAPSGAVPGAGNEFVSFDSADATGTTTDPKLVITHASSASPSMSVSRSPSPSISAASPSRSPSPSISALSPSISPSQSAASPSPSLSAASPSQSPSQSQSPSPSELGTSISLSASISALSPSISHSPSAASPSPSISATSPSGSPSISDFSPSHSLSASPSISAASPSHSASASAASPSPSISAASPSHSPSESGSPSISALSPSISLSPSASHSLSAASPSGSASGSISALSPSQSASLSASPSVSAASPSPSLSASGSHSVSQTSPSGSPSLSAASPSQSASLSPSGSLSAASPSASPSLSASAASPSSSLGPSGSPSLSVLSPSSSPSLSPSNSGSVSATSPSVSVSVSAASPSPSGSVSLSGSGSGSGSESISISPSLEPSTSLSLSPNILSPSPSPSPSLAPPEILCVFYRILQAVQARIESLDLAGNPEITDFQKFATDTPYQKLPLPCIIIAPYGQEKTDPVAGTNEREDVGYPIGVHILQQGGPQSTRQTENYNRYLTWRQNIRRAFSGAGARLADEDGEITFKCEIEPGPIFDPARFRQGIDGQVLGFRFFARETRDQI